MEHTRQNSLGFLVRIISEHSEKAMSLMFLTKTVGTCLVWKLKWVWEGIRGLGVPGSPSGNVPELNFYLHTSIWIFCTLFFSLIHDGLLQLTCFQMLCSKYILLCTFVSTYLLSCWFPCVKIFKSNIDSVKLSGIWKSRFKKPS